MAENETGERESAVGIRRAKRDRTGAAGREVRVVDEQSQGNVGEIDVACSQDPARAGFECVPPADVGHAVRHLERARVRGSRAAGSDRPHVPCRDGHHSTGPFIDVDAGDPELRCRVLSESEPRETQVYSAPADTQLVQPARSERVGIVEGDALRVDVIRAGARLRRRRWAGQAESPGGRAAGCSARTRGWRRRCRGRS